MIDELIILEEKAKKDHVIFEKDALNLISICRDLIVENNKKEEFIITINQKIDQLSSMLDSVIFGKKQ